MKTTYSLETLDSKYNTVMSSLVSSLAFLFASNIPNGILEKPATQKCQQMQQEQIRGKSILSKRRAKKRDRLARQKTFRQ